MRHQGSAAALRIDPEKPTVSALLERFEATLRLKDDGPEHVKDVMGGLRDAAACGHWTWPDQITADSVCTWLERRKAKGNKPKYRNDLRSYVWSFCSFAVKNGILDKNPIDAVPRARKSREPARHVPEVSEVIRLIVAADSDWRKGDRWLVYLVAATEGLRKGTLEQLDWEHCREAEFPPRFELPPKIMKAGEPATVWMTEEVARFLAEHRTRTGGKGLVFAGVPKKPEHFDRDLKKAGIPKARSVGGPTFAMHSLRHFASNRMKWASRFTDEERRQQNAHESQKMTISVYTDPTHVELGKKIYAMQPLLPPHFRPRWGERASKSGAKSLDSEDRIAEDEAATSRNEIDQEPDHIRIRSIEGRLGVATLVSGQPLQAVDGAVSGVVTTHGYREESPQAPVENGGSGSNPPTPILRPNTPDLIGAFSEVVQAQARLIAVLTGALSGNLDQDRKQA